MFSRNMPKNADILVDYLFTPRQAQTIGFWCGATPLTNLPLCRSDAAVRGRSVGERGQLVSSLVR